jgi:hypothetical protein
MRIIDLAPEDFMPQILRSAMKRWPDAPVRRVTRPWVKGHVYSYGICRDGAVIAYAKVNRAGAVQWVTPWPHETWRIVPREPENEPRTETCLKSP